MVKYIFCTHRFFLDTDHHVRTIDEPPAPLRCRLCGVTIAQGTTFPNVPEVKIGYILDENEMNVRVAREMAKCPDNCTHTPPSEPPRS